jgi:hypothetical protein
MHPPYAVCESLHKVGRPVRSAGGGGGACGAARRGTRGGAAVWGAVRGAARAGAGAGRGPWRGAGGAGGRGGGGASVDPPECPIGTATRRTLIPMGHTSRLLLLWLKSDCQAGLAILARRGQTVMSEIPESKTGAFRAADATVWKKLL